MKHPDLLRDKTGKVFLHYLLPSVFATLITSIYIFVDTVMVGQGVGPEAIAALNIVLPLFGFVMGLGLLFGVGGAVLVSVARAKGDRTANGYFTVAVIAGGVVSALIVLFGLLFFEKIAYALGAKEKLLMDYCKAYGNVIIVGAPAFLFSSMLQVFIRNDGAPRHAMIGVVAGGVLNVFLDYIFIMILGWGMFGAAFASVLGCCVSLIILITHFFKKSAALKFCRPHRFFATLGAVTKTGFPSFLIEIAQSWMVLLFNLQLFRYIGDVGVTVYGIITNFALIGMSLFNGVAHAAEPVIAANFGAGHHERIRSVRRASIFTAAIIAGVLTLFGVLFPSLVVAIFVKVTPKITSLANVAMRIYFCGFLFMGFNVALSTYFQSVGKPWRAILICLLRGMGLGTLFIFLFPAVFPVASIWFVIPVAEAITALIAFVLLIADDKRTKYAENHTAPLQPV